MIPPSLSYLFSFSLSSSFSYSSLGFDFESRSSSLPELLRRVGSAARVRVWEGDWDSMLEYENEDENENEYEG